MLAAHVFDRHACLDLAQEADDLLFGKTLLHVQSTPPALSSGSV
jgi:hypothetical protein